MEIKAKEKEDIINKTLIEWTRNQDGSQGFTSNPIRGECPVGCPYCYVKPFRARYGWHKDIRFYPQELEAIRKRKKPAGIFIGSTIELFHDKTVQFMPEIMDTIKTCPEHRFYLLTKQPQNLIKFSPFPENCWVGATCTGKGGVNHTLPYLMKVGAGIIYLSIEPFLKWDDGSAKITADGLLSTGINWLIIGACTGTHKDIVKLSIKYPELRGLMWGKRWTLQPKIEWVREIVEAADKAGIPVFLKDNLGPLIKWSRDSWAFEPSSNILRQEMPINILRENTVSR